MFKFFQQIPFYLSVIALNAVFKMFINTRSSKLNFITSKSYQNICDKFKYTF